MKSSSSTGSTPIKRNKLRRESKKKKHIMPVHFHVASPPQLSVLIYTQQKKWRHCGRRQLRRPYPRLEFFLSHFLLIYFASSAQWRTSSSTRGVIVSHHHRLSVEEEKETKNRYLSSSYCVSGPLGRRWILLRPSLWGDD